VRDYLDVVALASRCGFGPAARILADVDRYYTDPAQDGTPFADQVVRQLAEPRPRDARVAARLRDYKGLAPRWQDWGAVVEACRHLALRLEEGDFG